MVDNARRQGPDEPEPAAGGNHEVVFVIDRAALAGLASLAEQALPDITTYANLIQIHGRDIKRNGSAFVPAEARVRQLREGLEAISLGTYPGPLWATQATMVVNDAGAGPLWDAVHLLLHWIRDFYSEQWQLPEADVPRLMNIAERFRALCGGAGRYEPQTAREARNQFACEQARLGTERGEIRRQIQQKGWGEIAESTLRSILGRCDNLKPKPRGRPKKRQ